MRFLPGIRSVWFPWPYSAEKHFIESIPRGIENVTYLSENWTELQKYPELQK